MNYKKSNQGSRFYLSNLCFSIYREILHWSYSKTNTKNNIQNANFTGESINHKYLNSLIPQDDISKLQNYDKSIHKPEQNTFL